MGAGKTSIGRRLAKRLDISFYDSDHEVERAAGCPLKDIYEVYGEEAFRSGEYRVIDRLLDQDVHILATGGGSFFYEKTREMIKNKSISVWLKADIDTLVARVSRRNDRPLLENVENHRFVLEQLIGERYPLYEQADVIVETFDEPTNTTVDRVVLTLTQFIRDRFPTEYMLKST
jgi:shikimate kinase